MSALSLALFVLFFALGKGQDVVYESAQAAQESQSPALVVTHTEIIPTRFTWNRYTIVATATAAVVVVAGIVASASLLLPLITYKICYLFGGCGQSLNSYVDQFVATDGNPRQKRSLEYVGPILQTLAAAYEKYGPDSDPKKKFGNPIYFTK